MDDIETTPRDRTVAPMVFVLHCGTDGLDEVTREHLHTRLGVAFTDEDARRPGWSWLCPDRRVTVSLRDDGTAGLTVWPVGDEGTSDSWVFDQVVDALFDASLVFDAPDDPRM